MLHTMKRGLFVGSVVVVVAALLQRVGARRPRSRSREVRRPRAAHGMMARLRPVRRPWAVSAAPASAAPGFGGPGFGGPGIRRSRQPGAAPACAARRARRRTARRRGAEDDGGVPRASRSPTSRPTSRAARRSPRRRRRRARRAAGLITALTNDGEGRTSTRRSRPAGSRRSRPTRCSRASPRRSPSSSTTGLPFRPRSKAGPLDAAATYLGMTVADVQTALKGGKTLAQLVDGAARRSTASSRR